MRGRSPAGIAGSQPYTGHTPFPPILPDGVRRENQGTPQIDGEGGELRVSKGTPPVLSGCLVVPIGWGTDGSTRTARWPNGSSGMTRGTQPDFQSSDLWDDG